jgi:hypothetical protein
MKHILAVGVVLALATPALADPYQSNLRSKQVDAHEMRDARGQPGAPATVTPAGARVDGYVAEYRSRGSDNR